jgi:hypothetical protein
MFCELSVLRFNFASLADVAGGDGAKSALREFFSSSFSCAFCAFSRLFRFLSDIAGRS